MKYLKQIFLCSLIIFLNNTPNSAQQTYVGAHDKHTYLLDTKLLKNGDLVLLEFLTVCGDVNVKLLKPNGEEESIFTSGFSRFRSFNELPDNNWALVLVTNATIDTPEPDILNVITFIDGAYDITSISDENISIPLDEVSISAVINSDELVLATDAAVYFVDFQFMSTASAPLSQELQIMKSPIPDEGFLYFKYLDEDAIRNTDDRFISDQLISFNLGDSFRDIHYLGDYAIFQDENQITAVFGIFGFEFLEQGKEIHGFRQHGQNLIYHTIDTHGIITLNKIFLDDNQVLQTDNIEIDVSEIDDNYLKLYWDGVFKGMSYHMVPLPRTSYDDLYESHNYVLDYNFVNYDLITQSVDVSIDSIEFDITSASEHYIDVNMQLTITNNSLEILESLSILSNGYDGIECFDDSYFEKLTQLNVQPGESFLAELNYSQFGFPDPKNDLCIYIIGANNKSDDHFEDNIYCTPISTLTSINEIQSEDNLTVFPNPAQNRVHLESDSPSSIFHIYNSNGQLKDVWEMKSKSDNFDTSNLSKGLYFIVDQKNESKVVFTKI